MSLADDLNNPGSAEYAASSDKRQDENCNRFVNADEAKRFLDLLDPDQPNFIFSSLDDNKERAQAWRFTYGKLDKISKKLVKLRQSDTPDLNEIKGLEEEKRRLEKAMPAGPETKLAALDNLTAWMTRRQSAGFNVCVCVAAMRGKKRTLEEITYFRAVFAEMDNPPTKDWPLAPSIVIESSPGRFHVYWLLDLSEPMARDVWERVQKRIVADYGADPGAKDGARTMRLPGSWNLKTGRAAFQTRIVSAEGFSYMPAEIIEAFPPIEPEEKRRGPKPKWESTRTQDKGLSRFLGAEGPLEAISPDDYSHWLEVGMALHAEGEGSSEALRIWDAWSRQSAKYQDGDCDYRWNGFKAGRGGGASGGKIFWLAEQYGWRKPEPKMRTKTKAKPKPNADKEAEFNENTPPPHDDYPEGRSSGKSGPFDMDQAGFTEDALALDFADRYSSRLRYVNQHKDWMAWDGTKWKAEKTLATYDLVRGLCREASNAVEEDNKKLKAILRKGSTVSAVETMARSDRKLAITPDAFDANDLLLNTPGGIIDLRTGKNHGHDPRAYCTKITDVVPTGGDCPKWKLFLDQVTDGNKELQAYLKRCAGYWLTGSIREHALWFIYGPGGNGKGVFINTITAIMALYHVVSPAETFAEKKQDRHPTELARLDGARLVISQETEQGQYWAEARVKSLTGGDKIAARFMRGDFFEFDPKFKLCIVGNHKPQFRTVDDALRRRFNLIPFDVDVKAKYGVNPNLQDELKAEYGAIMAWMVEGCLEWQRDGLNAPECVLAATADYLDSEDNIGCWIRDMCVIGQTEGVNGTRLAELFDNWRNYADFNHFPVKNNKYLQDQLVNRKFRKDRDKRGAIHFGIRLKTIEEQEVSGVRDMGRGFASGTNGRPF
jgi:putative DNA primase/helicase